MEQSDAGGIVRAKGQYRLVRLTQRERQVLTCMLDGRRNDEIAASLIVSGKTVEFHVRNLLQKLNVHSRTEALLALLKEEVILPSDTQDCVLLIVVHTMDQTEFGLTSTKAIGRGSG